MEDRETARMRKYGESKTTRIMMATVPHVTSSLGLRKFQANGFLLTQVYKSSLLTKSQALWMFINSICAVILCCDFFFSTRLCHDLDSYHPPTMVVQIQSQARPCGIFGGKCCIRIGFAPGTSLFRF